MTFSLLQHGSFPPMLVEQLQRHYRPIDTRGDVRALTGLDTDPLTVLVTDGETAITGELMAQLPALRCIVVFGVGYDQVDIQGASERGIVVSHTPGVLTEDVADLAFGLILATGRQISAAGQFIRDGSWHQARYPLTRRVCGSRLGILGMGRIGQSIARRALGFDMGICWYDPHGDNGLPWRRVPDLLTLAKESDFLVSCVPGGASTREIINGDVLDALGPDGVLINISRGSVVDQPALVDALTRGLIGGAGLDVFDDEPHVPHRLFSLPNVVLTPHMASATWETRHAMSRLVMDNLTSWFSGQGLVTPVPESLAILSATDGLKEP